MDRILETGERLWRRNFGSPHALEQGKRRALRAAGEVLRRLRRAGLILAGLLVALIGYSLVVAPLGFLTWMVALPTALLLAFLSLFWGSWAPAEQPARGDSRQPRLDIVAARARDALIDRYEELPPAALDAADATIARLRELQPHLVQLEQEAMLGGDARRLICDHLPRLVDAYLALPVAARTGRSEESRQFGESLALVAEELDHLLEQCCRARELTFATQHRFIESRYKADPRLSGN